MKHSTSIAQSLFLFVLLAGTGACQESGHMQPSGETRVTVTPIATGLQHCLADGGGVDGVDVKRMERLFLSLA